MLVSSLCHPAESANTVIETAITVATVITTGNTGLGVKLRIARLSFEPSLQARVGHPRSDSLRIERLPLCRATRWRNTGSRVSATALRTFHCTTATLDCTPDWSACVRTGSRRCRCCTRHRDGLSERGSLHVRCRNEARRKNPCSAG